LIDFKRVTRWALLAGAVLITIFIIFKLPDDSLKDQKFGIARDFILFICSTLITYIVSYWFAKKESNEKIDTIAERSFEKMAKLTLQIEQTKKFLGDTIRLAQTDAERSGPMAGLLAYMHRINGSIANLDQITTQNDTFRSDWLGVVSPSMKKTLSAYLEALSNLPEIVNELSKPSFVSEAGVWPSNAEFDRKVEDVERAVPGAGRLIDELKYTKRKTPSVAALTQLADQGGTEKLQSGQIKINVLKPSYRATGTGSLTPRMANNPNVDVELVEAPSGVNASSIRFPVGVGTNFNFNIMLSAMQVGDNLAVGEYVFQYRAVCG
jgi:hypothetical protein